MIQLLISVLILSAAVCTAVISEKSLFYRGTIFPEPKLQTRPRWDLEEGVFWKHSPVFSALRKPRSTWTREGIRVSISISPHYIISSCTHQSQCLELLIWSRFQCYMEPYRAYFKSCVKVVVVVFFWRGVVHFTVLLSSRWLHVNVVSSVTFECCIFVSLLFWSSYFE